MRQCKNKSRLEPPALIQTFKCGQSCVLQPTVPPVAGCQVKLLCVPHMFSSPPPPHMSLCSRRQVIPGLEGLSGSSVEGARVLNEGAYFSMLLLSDDSRKGGSSMNSSGSFSMHLETLI